MKIFVYYHDDYYDNDGVGLKEFDSEALAAEFIAGRLKQVPQPNANNYTVIRGTRLSVNPVEYATKIELKG